MNLNVISSKYENIPIPVLEFEINAILKEIIYLKNLF